MSKGKEVEVEAEVEDFSNLESEDTYYRTDHKIDKHMRRSRRAQKKFNWRDE